jgi:succinate dehydrogenase/fumarate reductase flavoprotein subunit
MKQVSRRDFVKGAMGIAAMGMLSACASAGETVGSTQETAAETQETPASNVSAQVENNMAAIEDRYQADILIIGGGMAGFSAGIHALELGCENVLIVDKAGGEGADWAGSSMICGGSFLIPVSDSEEDAEAYAQAVYAKGQQKGNMDLIRTLAQHAYSAHQWLIDQGCEYGEPYSVFPANPEVLTSVAQMLPTMTVLRDKYKELGGAILYHAKAVKLNYDNTGICGALIQGEEDYYNVAAKKTILCTGGYAANKQFLEDHVGENGDEIMCRARSSATGDGIYMAQAVGGYTVNSCGMKSIHLSAVDPVYKEKGQPGNDIPNMIAINSEGKRFVDEALGSVRHGQAVFQQAVQKDGLIFDSKVLETVQATMDKLHDQGVVTWETDTLEEMAEIFGVDPATLVATVDEFNAHVNTELGITEGLAVNKTKKALTIDTPPYYGIYPLVPGTSLTFGGLAVNTKAEVLQADGMVVKNLYAAGEGTGGFFYDDYFGGTCMTRCVVYGHIAVESAMAEL